MRCANPLGHGTAGAASRHASHSRGRAALRQNQAPYLSLLHHMQIAPAEGRRNESMLGIPALAVEIRVDCIAALHSGVQEILVEVKRQWGTSAGACRHADYYALEPAPAVPQTICPRKV